MRKILVGLIVISCISGSTFALTPKEQKTVDQVVHVVEVKIDQGVKTRERYIVLFNKVIVAYLQYADIFTSIKDGIAGNDESDNSNFLVTSVQDGDTITLANDEVIRLIGVDAPERYEQLGGLSRDFAITHLLNKKVTIEKDATQGEKDVYGRTLAYVWFGDTLFNEHIIRQGYASEYIFDKPYKYQERLQYAMSEAKKEKIGIREEQYACEAKTYCSQMTSCQEAAYYLQTCGLHRLDRDGDGVPCENLC